MGFAWTAMLMRKTEWESLPVATAATILLGLLGVDTVEAVLGEELGKVILGKDSALGQAGVVLLVVLVRSSHYKGDECQPPDNLICLREGGR